MKAYREMEKLLAERMLFSVSRMKQAYRLLRAVHLEVHYGEGVMSDTTHLDIRDFFIEQANQDRRDYGLSIFDSEEEDEEEDELDNSERSY